MTIYLTDDAFSVKAKRFNKMFASILALFFLLTIRFACLIFTATMEETVDSIEKHIDSMKAVNEF